MGSAFRGSGLRNYRFTPIERYRSIESYLLFVTRVNIKYYSVIISKVKYNSFYLLPKTNNK